MFLNIYTDKINHLKTYEKLKTKPIPSFSSFLQICLSPIILSFEYVVYKKSGLTIWQLIASKSYSTATDLIYLGTPSLVRSFAASSKILKKLNLDENYDVSWMGGHWKCDVREAVNEGIILGLHSQTTRFWTNLSHSTHLCSTIPQIPTFFSFQLKKYWSHRILAHAHIILTRSDE